MTLQVGGVRSGVVGGLLGDRWMMRALLFAAWLEAYHHDSLDWFGYEDSYQARTATLRTAHALEQWAFGDAELWEHPSAPLTPRPVVH